MESNDSNAEDLSPLFPSELERKIFEIAALEIIGALPTPYCALNLQLTAKRVRSWVKPLLERIFVRTRYITYPKSIRIEPEARPYITHFLFSLNPSMIPQLVTGTIIEQSRNIENLAIWSPPDVMRVLYPFVCTLPRLKRFSGYFQKLSREEMLVPVFRNLTHLEVHGIFKLDVILELKNLSHLAAAPYSDSNPLFPQAPDEEFDHALRKLCSPDGILGLQVVKIFSDALGFIQNIRVVHFFTFVSHFTVSDTDWLRELNGDGLLSSWELASRIVYARTHGYMDYAPDKVFSIEPKFNFEEEFNDKGQIWWKSLS